MGSRGLWKAVASAAVTAATVAASAAGAHADVTGAVTVPDGAGTRPLAGALVMVLSDGSWSTNTTTNAAGRWSIPEIDGRYEVRVYPPRGAEYRSVSLGVHDLSAPTVLDTELEPSSLATVSGVLRAGDGTPVAGARVLLTIGSMEWLATDTDATGAYSFAVSPGRYEYDLVYPTWRGPMPYTWQWRLQTEPFDADGDRTIDLRLPPTADLSLLVLDRDGRAIPGTAIAASLQSAAELGDLSARFISRPISGTTDSSGRLTASAFVGSSSVLPGRATPPPGSGYGWTTFTVPVLRGAETVVVEPPPLVRLHGTVRDSDGSAVVGAEVEAVAAESSSATTDADGDWALDLTPGSYSLTIVDPSRDPHANRPFWRIGVDELDVSGELALDATLPPRVSLTARVLDGAGLPAWDAAVILPPMTRTLMLGRSVTASLSMGNVAGWTDADGSVAFPVFVNSGPQDGRPGRATPAPSSPDQPVEFDVPPVDDADAEVTVRLAGPAAPDTAPPWIDCDPPPLDWQPGDVALACRAGDDESGLVDPADAAFELVARVGPDEERPLASTDTRRVCDRAGNCVVAGPLTPVRIDNWAPRFAFEQSTTGGAGWWNSAPASIAVEATDANIGTVACAVDGTARALTAPTRGPTTVGGRLSVAGEGRHQVGCTATDRLGHVRNGFEEVRVDLHGPVAPTAVFDREPAYGTWFADAVEVSFGGEDRLLADGTAGSGVDPASLPRPQLVTTEGANTVSGVIADRAGNVSPARNATVRVDAFPPSSTLTCPEETTRGTRATARWSDADTASGLAGTATGTVTLDTSAVGWHVAEHEARDRVGHVTTSTCAYRVVYRFQFLGGLLAPPLLNAVAPGVATVAVRFSLGGDGGLDPVSGVTVQQVSCVGGLPEGPNVDGAGALSFDATTARYTYRWDATPLSAGTCQRLTLALDDGTSHAVTFAR